MKYKSHLDPLLIQPCKLWIQSSNEVVRQYSKEIGNLEQRLGEFQGSEQNYFSNRQKKQRNYMMERFDRNEVHKKAREASKIHLLRVLI